jgi:hypothetical protein
MIQEFLTFSCELLQCYCIDILPILTALLRNLKALITSKLTEENEELFLKLKFPSPSLIDRRKRKTTIITPNNNQVHESDKGIPFQIREKS